MRLLIWIVLLGILPAVLSKPAHHNRKALKRGLSKLLRKVRQNDGNCQELSDAAGEAAQHTWELVSMAIDFDQAQIDDEFVTEVSRRLFGFDMVTDDEERLAYTCDVTQATTLSGLKGILDDKNFHENYLKLTYNFLTAALPNLAMGMVPGPGPDFIHALEASGLTILDPQGTAWAADIMFGELYDIITSLYEPEPLSPASNQDKCNRVNNALVALIRSNPDIVPAWQVWTGLAGLDIRSLVCDIIEAADEGFGAIYEVINSNGIINAIYHHGYPIIQGYVPIAITRVEELEQMFVLTPTSQDGQYPYNYGGYYPGPPTKRHSKRTSEPIGQSGQYGSYGSNGDSNYGSAYTGEGGQSIDYERVITAALRFLHAMQNSGLLDLPIDL